MTHRYPSKVLLFGEHTVIQGGSALAIPFDGYSGHWSMASSGIIDQDILHLYRFVKEISARQHLDMERWKLEIEKGLYFESTIPIGYGLGSSGALVAAVADRYGTWDGMSQHHIMTHFASIEECYHAKSSGFDPYISYTGQSILRNGTQINPVECHLPKDTHRLCLINTAVARSSGAAITSFQDYAAQPDHQATLEDQYLPQVSSAIERLLSGDMDGMFHHFEEISRFQFDHLPFLIDPGSRQIWEAGLQSDFFKIKICGAGQGGFLLCLTSDLERLMDSYPERSIIAL